MKTPSTNSAAPPDATEYSMPAELGATPHPIVEAEQRAGAIVAQVLLGVRNEMREHMSAVKLELRAMVNDNSIIRENMAVMNKGLADFQRLQVIPLREALESLRSEQGSTVIENQRKLEAIIQALTRTLDAAGGIIPADLKQQIADGRFENLPHRKEGSMVEVDEVSAMIEAAYVRGRADGAALPPLKEPTA